MRLMQEVARVNQFRESLCDLSEEERAALVRGLGDDFADAWEILARDAQLPPTGDWWCWILGSGRGYGKTRALSGTIHLAVRAGYRRIHLVCPSFRDVVDVMVDGPSGILATAPPGERPRWVASRHRVEWDSGATVTCFSAENCEALRGPQCQLAFCDELAKMPEAEDVFGGIMYGLRLGPDKPRLIVATTPRPTQFYKRLVKMPGIVVTGGSTFDNVRNLPPEFLAQVTTLFDGTRTGRQELHGELLLDPEDALFKDDWLVHHDVPEDLIEQVTIGVDPSGGGDEIGIVVCALLNDGRYAVLADRTVKGSPATWGEAVVKCHDDFDADDVAVEINFGGVMAAEVVRQTAERLYHLGERESGLIRVKEVHASRGKVLRAEPISLLYEKQRVLHRRGLDLLEGELLSFSRQWDRAVDGSPNRLDAAVWALTRLSKIIVDIPIA